MSASATTSTIPSTAISAFTIAAPTGASWLIALLFDQRLQLTVLQHLAEASDGKAKHSNGGAQIECLLQRSGGAHLVVTQPDPESAAFTASTAFTASAAASSTAEALPTSFSLSTLLLRLTVGITHGPWPGIRRKCGASSVCCR